MQNYNTAYSTNFRFEFVNAPALNYFIQTAQIPGMSANGVDTPYRGHNINMQADRIEYEPLSFQFLVDEEFENYLFIHNWMKTDVSKEKPPVHLQDATLHVLTGNKTKNLLIRFYGMFPQMLGSIDFESAVTDTNTILCNVTFRYQYFTLERAT